MWNTTADSCRFPSHREAEGSLSGCTAQRSPPWQRRGNTGAVWEAAPVPHRPARVSEGPFAARTQ